MNSSPTNTIPSQCPETDNYLLRFGFTSSQPSTTEPTETHPPLVQVLLSAPYSYPQVSYTKSTTFPMLTSLDSTTSSCGTHRDNDHNQIASSSITVPSLHDETASYSIAIP